MKAWQFFFLMGAIYIAPHMGKLGGALCGVACLVAAVFFALKMS